MVRLNLRQSTRSIYLGLACVSLTLHILLALFCLSVLQSACVLPTSSSSSVPRIDPVSHAASSSSSSAASNRQANSRQHGDRHKPSVGGTFENEGIDSFSEDLERARKLIGVGKVSPAERGRSKLQELFKHPLYNLPRPKQQEDDWLLRLKTDAEAEDIEKEEKANRDSATSDSDW